MQRYAQLIRVRPEKLDEYKRLHAAVWPKVLEQIRNSNMRNYSIYYKDGLLFAYFEYIGDESLAVTVSGPKMKEQPLTGDLLLSGSN